jgi:hypothetical protein
MRGESENEAKMNRDKAKKDRNQVLMTTLKLLYQGKPY